MLKEQEATLLTAIDRISRRPAAAQVLTAPNASDRTFGIALGRQQILLIYSKYTFLLISGLNCF